MKNNFQAIFSLLSLLSAVKLASAAGSNGSPEHHNSGFGHIPFSQLNFESPEFRAEAASLYGTNHQQGYTGNHDYNNGYDNTQYPIDPYASAHHTVHPYSSGLYNQMNHLTDNFAQGMHVGQAHHGYEENNHYNNEYGLGSSDQYHHHQDAYQGHLAVPQHEVPVEAHQNVASLEHLDADLRDPSISFLTTYWNMDVDEVVSRLNRLDPYTLHTYLQDLLSGDAEKAIQSAHALMNLSGLHHDKGKGKKKESKKNKNVSVEKPKKVSEFNPVMGYGGTPPVELTKPTFVEHEAESRRRFTPPPSPEPLDPSLYNIWDYRG